MNNWMKSEEAKKMFRLAEIERKYMPQVDTKDLPDAIKRLKESGVGVGVEQVPTSAIQPSQTNYIPEKVNRIIEAIKGGEYIGPVILSKDLRIVDGHHRVIAVKQITDGAKMNAIVIDLPIKKALKAYMEVSDEES